MVVVEPNSPLIEAGPGGAAAHLHPSSLRTWWIILHVSIEERLVYRGDFALGTLMRFLPLVTQVFFWAPSSTPWRARAAPPP